MEVLLLGGALIWLLCLLVPIILGVWSYRDAKSKGYGDLYALGILLLNIFVPIIGWIIYLLIRNR